MHFRFVMGPPNYIAGPDQCLSGALLEEEKEEPKDLFSFQSIFLFILRYDEKMCMKLFLKQTLQIAAQLLARKVELILIAEGMATPRLPASSLSSEEDSKSFWINLLGSAKNYLSILF